MKNYGSMKKVEFTGKEVNELSKLAKAGAITMKKWYFMELMKLTTYYGYDDNRTVEREEGFVKMILKAVAENNLEEAQKFINNHTEGMWKSFTNDYQKKLAPMDKYITVKA